MIFKMTAQLPGMVRIAWVGMQKGRLSQVTQALKAEGVKPKEALAFLQKHGKHIDPKKPLASLQRLWQARNSIHQDLRRMAPDGSALRSAKALSKAGLTAHENGLLEIALKNMEPTSMDWVATGLGLSVAGTLLAVKGGSAALSVMGQPEKVLASSAKPASHTIPSQGRPQSPPVLGARVSPNTEVSSVAPSRQVQRPEYLKPASEWRLPLLASKIT
ncbi:MAG: hypothetical protein ACKO37_10060 [Vampirovibrionales bacterium]